MESEQDFFYNLYHNEEKGKNMLPFSTLENPPACSQSVRSKLTFGQSIVHEFCKQLAKNERKGLLVLHSTGSGKTCVASGVMHAFYETTRKFIYVSSVAGLKANPYSKFEACAKDFFSDKKVNESRIMRLSFAQLAHAIYGKESSDTFKTRRKFLENSVVIIDEVHKLFHPLPTQVQEHDQLRKFFLRQDKEWEKYNMKIIIMTATPGDDPDEVVQLLNIIRDDNKSDIVVPNFESQSSINDFTRSILGMVSYIDMSNDTKLYPSIEEEEIEVQMRENHFREYEEKLYSIPNKEKDFDKRNVEQYMKTARRWSNSLFNNKFSEIEEFSTKMAKLLNIIEEHPNEKHYVYSAFFENRGYGGHGVRAIGNFLKDKMGYTQLTLDAAKSEEIGPAKRFIYLINSEVADPSQSESKQAENVQTLINFFNSHKNKNGAYAQIILASQGYNESVDLTSVRHIHVLEPLVAYAKYIQLKGRAARYCSHQQLGDEFGDWTVYIHNYISKGPPDSMQFVDANKIVKRIDSVDVLYFHANPIDKKRYLQERENLVKELKTTIDSLKSTRDTIDRKIKEEAKTRYIEMEKMQQALIIAAIDCRLTANYHKHGLKCFT